MMNLCFYILLTLFLFATSEALSKRQAIIFGSFPEDQTDCNTPDDKKGLCTPLFDCSSMYSVLVSGKATPDFYNLLRSSICFYENKVPVICCPLSSTSSSPRPATLKVTTREPSTPEPITEPVTEPVTEPITEPFTNPVTNPSTTEPKIDGGSSSTSPSSVTEDTTSPRGGFRLLPEKCGNSTRTVTRIVGGRPSNIGDWPWLGALGYRDFRGKLEFLCGGALITNQHILTAAHCIHGRRDLELVRLGEHDLDRDDEVKHKDYLIAERIEHEEYDSSSYVNDIAILKLDRPVEFIEKSIMAGCLPMGEFYEENLLDRRQAYVAGWGSIAYNNVSSPILMETALPIVTNEECQEGYAAFRTVIHKRRLCAGLGGTDACQGDSGGPLNIFNPRTKLYDIVGVVSVGFRCAEEGFPGIYTRVTEYLDWIEKHLQ